METIGENLQDVGSWDVKFISPPLRRIMAEDDASLQSHLTPANSRSITPVACWQVLDYKFNLPNNPNTRYWITLSNKPSRHCWPIWIEKSGGYFLFHWYDAEEPEALKDPTRARIFWQDTAKALVSIVHEDISKWYVTIEYEERK